MIVPNVSRRLIVVATGSVIAYCLVTQMPAIWQNVSRYRVYGSFELYGSLVYGWKTRSRWIGGESVGPFSYWHCESGFLARSGILGNINRCDWGWTEWDASGKVVRQFWYDSRLRRYVVRGRPFPRRENTTPIDIIEVGPPWLGGVANQVEPNAPWIAQDLAADEWLRSCQE